MKFCRFVLNGQPHFGLVESVGGREMITRLLNARIFDAPDLENLEDLPSRKIAPVALDEAQLLAPAQPSKIVCIGRNYAEHARELGNAVPEDLVTFLKPPSALIGHGEQIRRPPESQRVDHEGELGIVIGRTCRNMREDEEPRDYILGYTCVNDVTARDLQKKDVQWTRGKGFDTFCPAGPVVVTEHLDLKAGVQVETRVNGGIRQSGNTRDFIFPVEVILRYISRIMTLYPGDLIPTGTPPGVGPLNAGDTVEISVEGVGVLRNQVVDEA